ncbi:MAG: sigma 54-interacting transcriptional regulator [Deltaproteobacteria bacterium]|nr:sigma 54-interacting transcriptional regulator [Deltaproteobacteria bacterium]MBI3296237.1 sigma 54-interacting transcriptional regulator [Deltaproteobacteria bacterium]
MKGIVIAGDRFYSLSEGIFSVGSGAGAFDVTVERNANGPLFSIRTVQDRCLVFPIDESLTLNGRPIRGEVLLQDCDVVQWPQGRAIFLAQLDLARAAPNNMLDGVRRIYRCLESESEPQGPWLNILSELLTMAGAEFGAIVTNLKTNADWEIVASLGYESPDLKRILSNSVVNETIKSRKPLVVESVVGHPLGAQDSVISSKVFSVACIPLLLRGEVFGCVYLATKSAGRAIRLQDEDILSYCLSPIAISLVRGERPAPELIEGPRALLYDSGNPPSPMVRVVERTQRLAGSGLNVLVHGETGTGKELLAHALHDLSDRKKGPFVAINCGAIPSSLIESTLFGHVKGSFTGANRDAVGKIAQADGGTLFLDEIAELPLDLQVRLLRVLQEKIVEPVGANEGKAVDFRVVSASHQELATAVEKGTFRKDLFYRICGAEIVIPPLRDRKMDIPLLSRHFLKRQGDELGFSPRALERLVDYAWPGNVRELEQVVARSAALANGSTIEESDLELTVKNAGIATNLERADDEFRRKHVENVLAQVGGNRRLAAERLGVSERTLYRYLSDSSDSLRPHTTD